MLMKPKPAKRRLAMGRFLLHRQAHVLEALPRGDGCICRYADPSLRCVCVDMIEPVGSAQNAVTTRRLIPGG